MSTDIEDAQETTHYVPEGIPPRSTRPSRRHLYQPLTNLAASGGGCPNDPRENVAAQASTGRLVWTFVVGGVLGAAAAGCFLFSANRQKRARSIVSGIATINACEGKGCTSFDCEKDQGDWVEKWSNSKKLYCCGMTCLEKSIRLKKKMPSGPPAVPKLSVPHSTTTTTTTTNTTTIKVTTTSTAETTAATTSKHAVVHPEPKIHAPSLLKGISYCPVPVKATESLKSDDWMTDLAKPLWSASGRGDLHVMHSLGANAVRLYGNNPELDHAHFLDEAHANDLKVIPGMSDFPYYQDPTTSCVATQYNCFSQIKKQYGENLKNGFLTKEKQYHPALRYFILINEPDLKMPRTANSAPGDAALLAKAIVSSFDAVLDAEKDARVVGTVINFTTTFSYAICTACPNNEGLPALGQMLLIEDAMRSPEKYGYRPKHQLYPAYLQRWVNSFNTANSAADLQRTFFTHYGKVFPTTPVFIGEYHKPEGPVLAEVKDILHLTTTTPLFLGISFFEFQVAYWKGGAEMAFGLFGLGGYPIGHFKYADGAKYTSWCLQPQLVGGALLPDALAEAYGGHAPDVSELCLPQPDTVPLSQLGYNLIVGLKDMDKFQRFVARVATHLGLDVVDGNGLKEFAKIYMDGSGPGYQFDNVVKDMQHRMPWLTRSDGARCVADRNASTVAVETAIKWGCAHLSGSSSCDQINAACLTAFEKGDWVFSRYFQSVHDHADPLQQCNFGGAAMYATPSVFSQHAAPQCVLP